MTYPIDDTTGLPVLPWADVFYRVNETSVEIRKPLPDVPAPNYYTPLPPYESYYNREVRVSQAYRPWYLFGGYKTRQVIQVQNWMRGRSEALATAYTEKTGEVKLQNGYEIEKRRPLTKDDVLPLAIKALDQYNGEQERKALLGDYPPKKLENDND